MFACNVMECNATLCYADAALMQMLFNSSYDKAWQLRLIILLFPIVLIGLSPVLQCIIMARLV